VSAAESFYAHKRENHGSAYKGDCSECQRLWAALLAESKAKAGVS
jgi:hypothetical protein